MVIRLSSRGSINGQSIVLNGEKVQKDISIWPLLKPFVSQFILGTAE